MAPAIAKPLLSDLVAQSGKVPSSHIRLVGERPDLAMVDHESGAGIPLMDLKVVEAIVFVSACETGGFFMLRAQLVKNHGIPEAVVDGMLRVAREFFPLPESERLKCYSDDPKKAIRPSTSFNVRTEKASNWRDFLRLHCYPLESFIYQWPSNPPTFRSTHGTGTGLAIACEKGGPYHVNKHTLTRNDWQFTSDRAADNLKHIAGLAAAAFTTERVEIGLPPSLTGFKLSALACVNEAANPGGATEVFFLDSGSSIHAVGEARILQDIQLFPFYMWATLPDNSRLRIIGKGTIETNEFSIPNVHLVERLRNNLISVSQLDIDHAMCSCFHGRQCTVMIPGGDIVGGAILEDDGMYQLRFLQVRQPEE